MMICRLYTINANAFPNKEGFERKYSQESIFKFSLERSVTLQYDINMAFKRSLQLFKNNLITR